MEMQYSYIASHVSSVSLGKKYQNAYLFDKHDKSYGHIQK